MRRDLIALPDSSKIWIYQASLPISYEVSESIKSSLYDFTMKWSSHGHALDSYANLFHHQFLIIVADSSSLPSGCSIDSSVHVIENLGEMHGIDFFNRMIFSYMKDDRIYSISKDDFRIQYNTNHIDDETLVFDNLVKTKGDFLENWVKPLGTSWHKRFV